MQDCRLLRAKLIAYEECLASKAAIHKNLLAQTNYSADRSKFQNRDELKTNAEDSNKPKILSSRTDNALLVYFKFKTYRVIKREERVHNF